MEPFPQGRFNAATDARSAGLQPRGERSDRAAKAARYGCLCSVSVSAITPRP
jgi:hypothetical protein